MNERLKTLYKEVILAHQKDPYHYYPLETADEVLEAYNPLCGDQFKIYLKIDGVYVSEASFQGYGCAISKASSSILVQSIEGKTLEEVRKLHRVFMEVVSPSTPEKTLSSENEIQRIFEAFAAAREFPGRLRCATLSWEAVESFLTK